VRYKETMVVAGKFSYFRHRDCDSGVRRADLSCMFQVQENSKKFENVFFFKSTRITLSSVLHVSDQKKFEYAHSVYRTCSPVLQCFQDLEHIYIKANTLSSVVHVSACARPVSRRANLEDHAKCRLLFFLPPYFSACARPVSRRAHMEDHAKCHLHRKLPAHERLARSRRIQCVRGRRLLFCVAAHLISLVTTTHLKSQCPTIRRI
jgi:hypothetical protein